MYEFWQVILIWKLFSNISNAEYLCFEHCGESLDSKSGIFLFLENSNMNKVQMFFFSGEEAIETIFLKHYRDWLKAKFSTVALNSNESVIFTINTLTVLCFINFFQYFESSTS